MQFDRGYISPYFVTNADKMRVEMEDAYSDQRKEAFSVMNCFRGWSRSAERQAACDNREDVEGEALATLVVNRLRGGLRLPL